MVNPSLARNKYSLILNIFFLLFSANSPFLVQVCFPGNVSELQQVVKKTFGLSKHFFCFCFEFKKVIFLQCLKSFSTESCFLMVLVLLVATTQVKSSNKLLVSWLIFSWDLFLFLLFLFGHFARLISLFQSLQHSHLRHSLFFQLCYLIIFCLFSPVSFCLSCSKCFSDPKKNSTDFCSGAAAASSAIRYRMSVHLPPPSQEIHLLSRISCSVLHLLSCCFLNLKDSRLLELLEESSLFCCYLWAHIHRMHVRVCARVWVCMCVWSCVWESKRTISV